MKNKNTVLATFQYSIVSFLLVLLTSCGNDISKSPSREPIQTSIPYIDNNTTSKEPIQTGVLLNRDNNTTMGNEPIEIPVSTHTYLPWKKGILKVSSNNHSIEYTDGSDFFWMADTAWDMLIELNDEEIDIYLKNRKALGFNVILMRPVEDQENQKHRIGGFAFNISSTGKRSFQLPNEECWKHVDAVIEKAEKLGMYIGLLPSWNMTFHGAENRGGLYQGLVTIEDAKWYGKWIANRYKDNKNIIWVIGGDSGPGNPAGGEYTDDLSERKKIWAKKLPIWNALATEIHTIVKGKQLITFHPAGGQSTALVLFKDSKWLDFSMGQTGHCIVGDIDFSQNLVTDAYNNKGHLPIVDGEPKYEGIQKCFFLKKGSEKNDGSRFNGEELIETAYRQVFSGAFGYTYGHHAIWLFWEKEGDNFSSSKPEKSWTEALHDDGAKYMKYLVNLIKSRPGVRIPDQKVVGEEPGKQGVYDNPLATKGDGYEFIYQPKGKLVDVNLSRILSNITNLNIWSYNPLTGESKIFNSKDKRTSMIELPINDIQDMVYVFDDKSKKYGKPGVFIETK